MFYSTPSRAKILNFILIIAALVLVMAACAGISDEDIEVKDEKAVRLIKEGAKLYDDERYDEALEKFSQAETQSDLPEDKTRIADIISKAGFALLEKKLFANALSYYERSLEINRTLGNKQGLVNDYSYAGKIYTDIGKYEEGIRYFGEALKIQEELNDKAGIVHNLNNVANLRSYLGNYREPIDLLNESLRVSEEVKDSEQTAKTLINLGTIYFRLRNYQKSVQYLDRALRIAGETNKENLKAYALNLIGVVNRSQGNYEKALDYYTIALEINRNLGLEAEVGTNLAIIGELYKELGNYDEALKYLRESLEISERLKDKLMVAVNTNYLGEVEYRRGNYDKALKLYDSSLTIFEELGFKDRVARSFNNIGYAKGDMGRWDEAIRNFDRAIAIYRVLGDREWVRVSLFGKGVYLEERGDLIAAERSYKEAIEVFEGIREDVAGGEEAEQLFSEVNVKLYENLVALLLSQGRKEEALRYIERSRSKTLRDAFLRGGMSAYDEGTRGVLERFDELFRKEASISYELTKERSKPLPNLEKVDNLVSTLAETREEFSRVTARLKNEYPNLYSFLSIEPGNILELKSKSKLPADTVFLEYFVTEKQTYIFLINNKDLIVKQVSVKKEELNELVVLFRDLMKINRAIPTNGWRDDGSERYRSAILPLKNVSMRLYRYLIEPVENEIRNVETVAVVPFGSLHYLPFHVLARQNAMGDLEFLIEEKELVYLVSTSVNYLGLVHEGGERNGVGTVVAFGNPDLGEPDLALPYSEEEVRTIKEMFPDATVFIKKDATKANFKNSWGRYEVVHLAAHGLIQREPSILLAPLGLGRLTLSDITGLPPATSTNLVVLSACEAAIDRNGGGRAGVELNSIAFAFSMVGIPSVIATLWEVDDRATSELMEGFYRNLKIEKRFGYKALRKAQLSMLKRSDKYGQPFYWAPFILLGVWE